MPIYDQQYQSLCVCWRLTAAQNSSFAKIVKDEIDTRTNDLVCPRNVSFQFDPGTELGKGLRRRGMEGRVTAEAAVKASRA